MYANNAGTGYANANIFYLFLGAQPQWGYSNSTGVTFPIAFKECYAVVSNAHSNTTGNTDHYHLLSWTSTGAAFGYWNMSFYGTLYIALGVEYSGDIVHHVQQHFQFRFQLRHYSLQPYQKPQARQLRQPEQNIQVLPVLIYTFMELRAGISQAAIEQWGYYVESQNPTDYRYWSIPFTSHYITMATKTYYEPKEEAVPWLVGIDMQKFICGYGANFIGSSYVSCVGIGCQLQWGIISNNKAIFPLVFNVFVSSALLLSRGSGTGTWCGDSSNTTLTGISCVTPDYVLSGTYIAIGA